MKENGRWSLDPGGVVKEEGGLPLRLVTSAPEGLQNAIDSASSGAPFSVLTYNWLGAQRGGTHRSLVQLKGWERPRGPISLLES